MRTFNQWFDDFIDSDTFLSNVIIAIIVLSYLGWCISGMGLGIVLEVIYGDYTTLQKVLGISYCIWGFYATYKLMKNDKS